MGASRGRAPFAGKKAREQIVVAHSTTVRPYASILSVWLLASACAGTSERSQSIDRVDQLLTRIERVQAETAVAKESSRAALNALCTLVSPRFQGDAAAAFARFMEAKDASEEQAETLRGATGPMQDAAADVFQRWTKDMEAFGNSRMRQRSQARLDETRTRFQAIVGAAQTAQIALDAFHDELQDHALFLRHDLNAASVASIRTDVRELTDQSKALDQRLDATVAAANAYVESAALYGQIAVEVEPATPPPAATTATPAKKRTVTTLKPKAAIAREAQPAPEPDPAEVVTPQAPPVPEAPPTPEPEATPDGAR